ncbi:MULTISPECIES: ISL3 family transposase [unclassified Streptomyces]|uniref:ISL3 family transposase n=1 Tax=unclassified Streptomyces TaxID=2593676 RepID=UPI002473A7D5|nr:MULTISPECIES: ISL3 family transposase [unclassified Streptomyces]
MSHEAIRIDVCSTAAGAACPDCGSGSTRVHSSYLRFPADMPSGGRLVVLRLRVRRFFCPQTSCAQRTFAEQMPGLTLRHSRWTERLRSTLAAVGLALAGRAGARMARAFGVSISRSAVLRLLDALPEPEVPAPRAVGVDEYATRKGRVYCTVLVDVETRRPVDLLPDREASSLAAWLEKRPGIEIVCRDRAPFFAEGATAGAPQATQVADRWHLWHNLGQAAERAVARHRQCHRVLVPDRGAKADEPAPPEEKEDSLWRSERFANRVRARHATVHALLEPGHSRRPQKAREGGTSLGGDHRMPHPRPASLRRTGEPSLGQPSAGIPPDLGHSRGPDWTLAALPHRPAPAGAGSPRAQRPGPGRSPGRARPLKAGGASGGSALVGGGVAAAGGAGANLTAGGDVFGGLPGRREVGIAALCVARGLVLGLGVPQAAGLVGPAGPVRGGAAEAGRRAGGGAVIGGRGPGLGQAAVAVIGKALGVRAVSFVSDRLDIAGGVVDVVDVAGVAGVGLVDGVGVGEAAGAVLVLVEDLELLGAGGGAEAGLLDLAVGRVADVLDVVRHAVGAGQHAEAVVAVGDGFGGQAGHGGH